MTHMFDLSIEDISGTIAGMTISKIDPGKEGEVSAHTVAMEACKLTATTVKGTLTEKDLTGSL